MKMKHLFGGLLACAALSITSCSNEEVAEQGGNTDKVGAYMTLQLVGPASQNGTRTVAGGQGTQAGTAAESQISKVQILLCNPSTHKVEEIYDLGTDQLLPISEGVRTKNIKTVVGTFDVYVIANGNGTNIQKGDDITGKIEIDGVTQQLMVDKYAHEGTFMMFNECNGTDDVAGKTITISAANDFDHPATLADPVKMDRLATKVKSTVENLDITGITSTDAFITNVTLEGYKLLNGATKTNLQQKWQNVKATNMPWENVLITPELAFGTNAGNDNGYYNHYTDFRTIKQNAKGDYTVVKDLYDVVPSYNNNAKGEIYCMENRPSTTVAKLGNTTGLVYQFKVTVAGSDQKAGANCFYGYNDKYFASLAALQAAYPHAFENATAGDVAAQLAAAQQELADAYAAADKQDKISDFRTKYNVKVYADGNMYYTYFIKDKNYVNGGKPYYSVMRNTIYDLTVKKLVRIGTDIPGGWNPDVDSPDLPVDPVNVYMVVEAKVNQWVLSKEDIELK